MDIVVGSVAVIGLEAGLLSQWLLEASLDAALIETREVLRQLWKPHKWFSFWEPRPMFPELSKWQHTRNDEQAVQECVSALVGFRPTARLIFLG